MKSRNPRALLPCLAIVFGLVAAACGGGTDVSAAPGTNEPAVEASAEAGSDATAEGPVSDAPDLDLYSGDFVDLNGETIDFASFEGQDTVLWFWAPW